MKTASKMLRQGLCRNACMASVLVAIVVIDPGLGVPREQKMIKGHLPRVIYHQVYEYTKIPKVSPAMLMAGTLQPFPSMRTASAMLRERASERERERDERERDGGAREHERGRNGEREREQERGTGKERERRGKLGERKRGEQETLKTSRSIKTAFMMLHPPHVPRLSASRNIGKYDRAIINHYQDKRWNNQGSPIIGSLELRVESKSK
jgi:hypothetical protein